MYKKKFIIDVYPYITQWTWLKKKFNGDFKTVNSVYFFIYIKTKSDDATKTFCMYI